MQNKKNYFLQKRLTSLVTLFICFFLLKGTHLEAQTTSGILASWDFVAEGGSSSSTADQTMSGISTNSPSAVASLGSGLLARDYLGNGLTASRQEEMTLAGAISASDYISFTITPESNKQITISKISITPVAEGPSRNFALFSSVTGFAAANLIDEFTGGANQDAPLTDLTVTGHTDITVAVEFRIYIYGSYDNKYQGVGFGNSAGNDLVIEGSISDISGGGTSVPAPWNNQDVGSVGQAGTASYTSGTFTIEGSGADIWNTADGFHYVYQSLSGDGELTARVASIENTNSWAKAGVMIREDLSAGSKHAMTVITPGNGVSFQRRTATSSTSTSNTVTGINAPVWVRIVRQGDNFTSFRSADGSSWTQVGSAVSIPMAADVNIGLCVTAHNNTTLCTASFSNVSVTSSSDNQAPTVPAGLSVSNITQTSVDLSWNASSDNVGVTGYDVMSGTTVVKSVGNITSTNVSGLTSNTQYTYAVRAKDAAGNLSANSSTVSFTTLQETSLRDPENPSNTVNGLDYEYFEGSWNLLPDFSSLSVVEEGTVTNFDLSVRNINDNFGFRFTGYIDVPTDGDYTFYTSSDDGSKLYIGTTQVVDNDGLHGMQERSGTIGLKSGKHALTVVFFEKTGGEGLEVRYSGPGISKTLVPASALYRDDNSTIVTGSIVREYWSSVSGTSVSAIPVTTTPSGTSVLTSLEGPISWADNYGTRIRGYLVPSVTGSYTLRISGDDNSELWISTNDDPANKTRIAYVSGWTNSREWSKYPEQTASARTLNAGQAYYIEVLHKEGGGGDHVAVGWTGPGISTITVIPGANLAPFDGQNPSDTEAPTVPTGLTVTSSSQTSVSLSWNASSDNVGVTGYDVYTNGAFTQSVTGTSASIGGLACETSYNFRVLAKDAAGNSSALSSSVQGTTAACPPQSLTYDIGMNVGGITDYADSKPFADAMMQHRYWTRIGGVSGECNLDANYWPTEDATCLLYHGLSTGNNHGTYTVSYEGQPVTLSCNAASITDVVYNGTTNRTNCKFHITDQNHSYLTLTFTNTNNGVRNVKVMRPLSPGSTQAHSESQVFYEGFKQALAPFSILRTMDFTSTNHNEDQYWSDRTKWTDASQSPPEPAGKDYGWQGRPASWEAVIKLANELNKDVWICIPHMADDNYIQNVATLFRDGNEHTAPLNSGLKLYVEYSNEVWNWAGAFSQTPYARDMGNTYGYPLTFDGAITNDLVAMRRFCAMRTAQISMIFRQVFGDAQMMTRVRPLMMTQKGYSDVTVIALSFIDEYYGGASPLSDWADPHPVNYYIYGHSGTTYFSPEKNAGVDINSIWNSGEFDAWNNQVPKYGYISTWSKTFGLKTMAYEGNVHYTYDSQNTDAVIDQAVLDSRWPDELQEQFEVFASTGGDHWNFFAIEGWMPPTHEDIWNTNNDFYNKLVELTTSQRYPVTYGHTAPFSIDGGNVHAITRGWGEPTSGTVTLSSSDNVYASMYAFHANSAGTYNVVVEYSSNSSATLQIMVGGNEIYKQNLSSTGGSVASTPAIDISLQSNELYALRTACLNGAITIRRINVNSGSSKSGMISNRMDNTSETGAVCFPNPASDYLQVRANADHDLSSVELYNIQGSLILGDYNLDNREHRLQIDHLKPGLYIISVNYTDGTNDRIRITKK